MKKVILVINILFLTGLLMMMTNSSASTKAEIGKEAPLFKLQNHRDETFTLASRLNQGWTILFFYPKAFTPGCTDQVCTYRDEIQKLKELGAEVYGLSADSVKTQAKFHEKYHLNFDLLADPKAKVIKQYGKTYPIVGFAKRWTFVIDQNLVLRAVFKDVDPSQDAKEVMKFIKENS